MKKNTIIIIDGLSLIYRAYYGSVYTRLRALDGTPTNAIVTFIKMLEPLIYNAEYVLIAGDSRTKTFRHLLTKDYKSTRIETPPDLIKQFPIIEKYLSLRGLKFLYKNGYEADDVIAKVAKLSEQAGLNAIIYTSDRDLLQLVSKKTVVHLIKKSIKNDVVFTKDNFKQLLGLEKEQFLDYKALIGDNSDNIKGAKGIGPKTAIKLLTKYQTLDNLLAHIDELPLRLQTSLKQFQNHLDLTRTLITITSDFEINSTIKDFKIQEVNEKEIYDFLRNYGIVSFKLKKSRIAIQLEKPETKEFQPNYNEIKLENFHYQKGNKNYTLFIYWDPDQYHHYPEQKQPFFVESKHDNAAFLYDNQVVICNIFDLLNNQEFITLLSNKTNETTIYINSSKEFYYFINKLHITHVNALINDVKLVFHLLFPQVKNNIKNIELEYLKKNFSNIEAVMKNVKIDKQVQKKALIKAVHALRIISKEIFQQLKTYNDIYHLYHDIELPLTFVLAKMEINGVNVNFDFLMKQKQLHEEKLEKQKKQVIKLCNEEGIGEFNLDSPKQLSTVLFDKLGLMPQKKRSTDIEVLEKLTTEHPIIIHIIEYRKLKKVFSTYICQFLEKNINGRVFPYYHQMRTATGRISTSNPSIQNIFARNEKQKEFRKALNVQDPSYILFSADYSQIELRILAHLSNDQQLLDAFKNGADVHKLTAAALFNKDLTQITNKERHIAKRINFSIIYGMKAYSLANDLQISMKEAKYFINAYHQTYKGITSYKEETITFCKKHQYVETLFKRRRYLYDINSSNAFIRQAAEREAINARIQGSQSEIIKLAMKEINDKLVNQDCLMIAQIHDGLIFEIKKDYLLQMEKKIIEIMNNVVKLKVPLVTIGKTGATWFDL